MVQHLGRTKSQSLPGNPRRNIFIFFIVKVIITFIITITISCSASFSARSHPRHHPHPSHLHRHHQHEHHDPHGHQDHHHHWTYHSPREQLSKPKQHRRSEKEVTLHPPPFWPPGEYEIQHDASTEGIPFVAAGLSWLAVCQVQGFGCGFRGQGLGFTA